ncbi:MAG: hypothetical protein HQL48_07310 [Gammaproteobacteria bacterium]|nr:hypothetical protein [Gammaproteobacteria bacterium]
MAEKKCLRCGLAKVCRQSKMPFCPLYLYLGLLIVVLVPAYFLFFGDGKLNI